MNSPGNSGNRHIYCIDTSALLHAWRRDYPPDVFGNVWRQFSGLAGVTLVAPEEVLLELQRQEDDVYQWARSHEEMFLPPDPSVESYVSTIVNRWPGFLPDDSHDGVWADPYVIALAAVRQAIVVTGEKLAPANARRLKIPNVCQLLGIPCIDVLGLLRSQGCRF